uniref:D-isomer specific 2-hydroxyacid dehydrogenase catalytic domain-containing protein n=2 Tax=Aegilops tauschii subsp. strangulata TaxID=200361 RepID=A0A453J1R8_AEGTS
TAMESVGVLLLYPVNAYLEQELDRRFRLIRLWDAPPDGSAEFLRANASAIRAVVVYPGYGTLAELIDALPSLEIVASFSVGIDHVDLPKCRERGTSSRTTSPTSPSASPSPRYGGSRRPTASCAPACGRPRETTHSPRDSVAKQWALLGWAG